MKTKSLILITLILLCGCSSKKYEENIFKDIEPEKIVTIKERNIYHDKLEKIWEKDLVEEYGMATPFQIEMDNEDNLYIADNNMYAIYKLDSNGKLLSKIGGEAGKGPGEFLYLRSIDICDEYLYCADMNARRIKKFDLDGNLIWDKMVHSDLPISFECIQAHNNRIFLSGWIHYIPEVEPSLCYELDEDLNLINNYFALSDDFCKSFEKKPDAPKLLATVNRIYVDEGYLYFARPVTSDLLYKYNLSSGRVEYLIQDRGKTPASYQEYKKGTQYRIDAMVTVADVALTENYIFIFECLGPIMKFKDTWQHKISIFFKDDGKYIYSVWDKTLPYEEEGYNIAVREHQDNCFDIYLLSSYETGKLSKYFLKI